MKTASRTTCHVCDNRQIGDDGQYEWPCPWCCPQQFATWAALSSSQSLVAAVLMISEVPDGAATIRAALADYHH
jgi:hypothetical protein